MNMLKYYYKKERNIFTGVVELVDTSDSKSDNQMIVRVRIS